jgi:hypothetical protein
LRGRIVLPSRKSCAYCHGNPSQPWGVTTGGCSVKSRPTACLAFGSWS